jgi:hypothetical protein
VGLPTVNIRWGSHPQKRSGGSCRMMRGVTKPVVGKPTSRAHIAVTVHPNARLTDVIQTVLHEMTHAAGWMDHSHRFYNTLREAVAEATGVDCNASWDKVYEYDQKQKEDLHAALGDDLTPYPKKAGRAAARRAPVPLIPNALDDF